MASPASEPNTSLPARSPNSTPPANQQEQQQQPATRSQNENHSRSLSESLSESFAPFDHQNLIVAPFEREVLNDHDFNQKLQADILDLTIEFYAWASARPKFEEARASTRLEGTMQDVIEVEKTQGRSNSSRSCMEMTRARLNQFINHIQSAIAALAGPLLAL